MAVSPEYYPFVTVEVGGVSIATRRLLVGDNLDPGSLVFLRMMTGSVAQSVLRCKLDIARACQLAWASMRALPLLHHGVVLIETGISVLYDKSILHLDGGRGKQLFTWLSFLR